MTRPEFDPLAPRTLLVGHTSPDTAYVVPDYPYGHTLRCQIRYWVETATKGPKKGQQRFMSQTTNPKRPGEVWNAPKGSTYSAMVAMYLDHNGHVSHSGISNDFGLDPAQTATWTLTGLRQQLPAEQREQFESILQASRRYADPWQRWAALVADLVAFERRGGEPPVIDGVRWTGPSGTDHYVPERDRQLILAAARAGLTLLPDEPCGV